MTVRDAMTSEVVSLRETDSVLTGLKTLVEKELSGAPVVGRDDRLIGMVTEFDLLLAIDCVGEGFPISRVMHKDVVTVTPETDLEQARRMILTHNYRRLPVVENGKLAGILSRRDILRIRFGL
ncbi:MAG TPA: CBS domain-containing protein [Terriglobia bacterium]|nr:CBS domain-containing protein [Terriglobia bacterium]